jgi:predicted transcriptional regulator
MRFRRNRLRASGPGAIAATLKRHHIAEIEAGIAELDAGDIVPDAEAEQRYSQLLERQRPSRRTS